MAKILTTQEIETRLEILKRQLKEQKQREKAKLIKNQEINAKKVSEIIFKKWNDGKPIDAKVVEKILDEIGTNTATMNIINLRIKKVVESETEG